MTTGVVTGVVRLEHADAEATYGAKAVGLGDALRANLAVPPGFALSGPVVDAIAAGDEQSTSTLLGAIGQLPAPFAVRSSCVDEDGAEASFAGQHITVLNVPTVDRVPEAVRQIWWSANSDSAITYRKRLGVMTRPSVGVVVQSLLSPDCAGVMFTRNPITGADERMVEAAWGLGEAVVAGRVIPDTFRIGRDGEVLDRRAGLKRIAIRATPQGGTVDEDVPADLTEALCLDDDQLRSLATLAENCERVYGDGRDIEWAFANGRLYLLQCRAVTRSAGMSIPQQTSVQAPALARVPLFENLTPEQRSTIAAMFKLRTFDAGETVTKEGSDAAAFYVIESGMATVTVRGESRGTLRAGDFFGEIALIDQGARSATVTADTELVCQGLTLWDFRPWVEANPPVAWTLLETLARLVRERT